MRIRAGRTEPGNTNWKAGEVSDEIQPEGAAILAPPQLYVDVDTSAAEFSTTPVYVISVGGDAYQFGLQGTSTIYRATKREFRVWVRFIFGYTYDLTPEFANKNRWHVNWIGIEP